LAAIDMSGAALAAVAAYQVCNHPPGYDEGEPWTGLVGFILAWLVTSRVQDLYARKVLVAGARLHSLRGVVTCVLAFGTILLFGVALGWVSEVSRAWLLTWALGSCLWIGGMRLVWTYCFRATLRRGNCLDRALVISNSRQHARQLGDRIESESRGQISVVAVAAFPGTPDGVQIDWVEETVRDGAVDRVVITKFENAIKQSEALLARLMRVAVDVTMIPDLAELHAPVQNVDCIGMLPAVGLASRPLTAVQAVLKRAEDLLLSCLLTLVAIPMAAVVALAIKIDSPGPVLFGQWREGYHDRAFKVWKFRTMYHHVRDASAVVQTSRRDSRVTRVGRVLRRLSLDELPQLINVLQGEMSIVGPRPHALGMTSHGLPMTEVLEHYAARHRLKPGITGWAQVNGCRGEVDSHEKLRRRVSLDCYYIDHWSVSLDLWIIFRTLALLLFDSDAY
jgi:Undecaprenyl-phosphate glucose phosphotransferase